MTDKITVSKHTGCFDAILLTRQQNIASRHPRLSGIGRCNKLNSKKDSGQAGMTELGYLIAGLIVYRQREKD